MLNYIINHWDMFSSIIIFILITVYGVSKTKASATDKAKAIAFKLMFAIEKKADEYLTSNEGEAKFKLVVEAGYALFPPRVRLFVSKPTFQLIVQELHDQAIAFLENEIKKQTPVVSKSATSPTTTVQASNGGTSDAKPVENQVSNG